MEAYRSFANVYDEFMDNIPYDEWGRYIHELLVKNNIADGRIAELGCGTGSITQILDSYGYTMTGIDISQDMLRIAQDKSAKNNSNITYSYESMTDFSLDKLQDACVCVCDSSNYLTEDGELMACFMAVSKNLRKDGILIMDFKTEYFYKKVLGECTIAENRDDASFIWENYYDDKDKINEYILTLFIKEDNDMFNRYVETHYQRAYSIREIKESLTYSGLKLLNIYVAFTNNKPDRHSERRYLIAKKE